MLPYIVSTEYIETSPDRFIGRLKSELESERSLVRSLQRQLQNPDQIAELQHKLHSVEKERQDLFETVERLSMAVDQQQSIISRLNEDLQNAYDENQRLSKQMLELDKLTNVLISENQMIQQSYQTLKGSQNDAIKSLDLKVEQIKQAHYESAPPNHQQTQKQILSPSPKKDKNVERDIKLKQQQLVDLERQCVKMREYPLKDQLVAQMQYEILQDKILNIQLDINYMTTMLQ